MFLFIYSRYNLVHSNAIKLLPTDTVVRYMHCWLAALLDMALEIFICIIAANKSIVSLYIRIIIKLCFSSLDRL